MTIFTDLQDALANVAGIDTVSAGIILGSALTVAVLIALTWVLGETGKSRVAFIISGSLGIVISTMVGWYQPWVLVFIALVIVLAILRPFAETETA